MDNDNIRRYLGEFLENLGRRIRESDSLGKRKYPSPLPKKPKNKKIVSEREKEIAEVCADFIYLFYSGDDLTPEESKSNLEKGLIELLYDGHHSSNGILVTQDGFFLTPDHCVSRLKEVKRMSVRDYKGDEYTLEKVCLRSPKHDVALAKANLPGKCIVQSYRFYNTNNLDNIPVLLISRWGDPIKKYGFLEKIQIRQSGRVVNSPDHFLMALENHFFLKSIIAIPGDSGGIVVSPDGRLIGMFSSISANDLISSSGVKIIKAIELVDIYRRKMLGEWNYRD